MDILAIQVTVFPSDFFLRGVFFLIIKYAIVSPKYLTVDLKFDDFWSRVIHVVVLTYKCYSYGRPFVLSLFYFGR
jgi:hypothetical protein